MRPVLVSTFENKGGAAIAALRLHDGLREAGCDSRLVTRIAEEATNEVYGADKGIRQSFAKLLYYLNYLPATRTNLLTDNPLFSTSAVPSFGPQKINRLSPDVVHLHWIANFLRPEEMAKIDAPLLWTLHDMWPFTGGCHYSGGCKKYRKEEGCRDCPVLGTNRERDLSWWVWSRKQESWEDLDLTIVSPSNWLANCARESELFGDNRVKTIPNGVDLRLFKPRQSEDSRDALGLPKDRKLMLFGSLGTNEAHRKGQDLIPKFVHELSMSREKVGIVIFGKKDTSVDLEYPVFELGYLPNQKVPIVYDAVDLTVVPSREENLSNIVVESLASGTPVVAFETGGMPDLIDHKYNGYLAERSIGDFAEGIQWALEPPSDDIGQRARKTAEERFDIETSVQRYHELYKELI